MASPNLPTTIVQGVTQGHPGWHSTIHDFLNEWDLDALKAAPDGSIIVRSAGLWKVLNPPGVSGKVLKSSAAAPGFVWADDITGGTTASVDVGVQHVHAGHGSDANSGFSFGAAKATIEAAYQDLPSTGGVVMVAPGVYTDAFQVTKPNVKIDSLGMGSVRWDIPTNQIGCHVIGGHGFKLGDIEWGGNNQSTQGGCLLLDGVMGFQVERVFCSSQGRNLTSLVGIDQRPFVIKAQGGPTGICRGEVNDLHMEFCYSGVLLPGGGVYVQFTNFVGRGNIDRDHLYVRHQARTGAPDTIAVAQVNNGWAAHQSPNQYAFRFERAAGTPTHGGSSIMGVTTEPGANSAAHHYYIETDGNKLANLSMIGGGGTEGGVTNNAIAAMFAGNCVDNRLTNIVRTGQGGAATPQYQGNVAGQTIRD